LTHRLDHLERFTIRLSISATYPAFVRYAAHSLGEKSARHKPMISHKLSIERAAALRGNALSFEKNCSIGFRSGLYGGR
jgi:hypothetical protein